MANLSSFTPKYFFPYPLSGDSVQNTYSRIEDLAVQIESVLNTLGIDYPITTGEEIMQRGDAAGGDLVGTYPNPSIATDAVGTTNIADLAVTTAKILDASVTSAKIEPSVDLAGSPTTTTQSTIDNSTKIATTEFVNDVAANFVLGIVSPNSITNTMLQGSITYNKLSIADSIVNADIATNANIAATKISGTAITAADTGTVTSTMLLNDTILNTDINSSANIVDTKLATISTAGKVSNSATTATDANTASAIVARNASGNFIAGTITAALTGNATTATTSTNIAGGAGGSIPYQSAAATTALLANGTAGQVLASAGTTLAPTWSTADAITTTNTYTSWTATSGTIGGQLSGINSALAMTQNAQTASYTLVLTDRNKLVEISNASANNLTVPLNATVAYPIGSQITILQTGVGQTTIVATGGVTINATPGLKLRTQWSSCTLIKRATDTWVAIGDLVA